MIVGRKRDMYLTCQSCNIKAQMNHVDNVNDGWGGEQRWKQVFKKYFLLLGLDTDISIAHLPRTTMGKKYICKIKCYKGEFLCNKCRNAKKV